MPKVQFKTQATIFKTKLSSNPCCNAAHFYALFLQNCEKQLWASSCLPVCPSLCMERFDTHWMGFYEILHLIIFGKSSEKIQFSWKSGKNNGYFTWRLIYISIIFRSIHPIMKNVSDRVVGKIETNIMAHNFFFENHVVHEIMWKSNVQPGTIWHMRIAYWIPKATNKPSEYVISTDFSPQQWLQERASMLCFSYIACIIRSILRYLLKCAPKYGT